MQAQVINIKQKPAQAMLEHNCIKHASRNIPIAAWFFDRHFFTVKHAHGVALGTALGGCCATKPATEETSTALSKMRGYQFSPHTRVLLPLRLAALGDQAFSPHTR
jgi:hypothetical protein